MALTEEENKQLEGFLEFLITARNAWRDTPREYWERPGVREEACNELAAFAELILAFTATRRAENHIPYNMRFTWYETMDSFAASILGYSVAHGQGMGDYAAPMWELIAKFELYIRCGIRSPILRKPARPELAAIHRN